jgi:hypothetical protein
MRRGKHAMAIIIALHLAGATRGAPDSLAAPPRLTLDGQLSAWGRFSPGGDLEGGAGGRYIPRAHYRVPLGGERLLDAECSVNLSGDAAFSPLDSLDAGGGVKLYRAWARYTTRRAEWRLGLQKINFGAARLLRPLAWFDQLDPRDPLQLTAGVRGFLFRYYFPGNANLWLWALHGNKGVKGFELSPVDGRYPEGGGRLQVPVPRGEAAVSYHFRVTDARPLGASRGKTGEHRLGLDLRVDVEVGLWLECAWTTLARGPGEHANQEMITVGGDYTFPLGNGLAATAEQLLFSLDETPFRLAGAATFSALSLAYPLGVFDNLSLVAYHDWQRGDPYLFVDWRRQFDHLTFHLLAYRAPRAPLLPGQGSGFTGNGLQLLFTWNL